MATLPITDLLAELEILASQALDFGAQLNHFPARVLDWVNQLRGGAARTTDLYQLAVHDQLGLPRRPRFGKRRVPFYPLQTALYGRDRRSFTTGWPQVLCRKQVIAKSVFLRLLAREACEGSYRTVNLSKEPRFREPEGLPPKIRDGQTSSTRPPHPSHAISAPGFSSNASRTNGAPHWDGHPGLFGSWRFPRRKIGDSSRGRCQSLCYVPRHFGP